MTIRVLTSEGKRVCECSGLMSSRMSVHANGILTKVMIPWLEGSTSIVVFVVVSGESQGWTVVLVCLLNNLLILLSPSTLKL